MLACHKNGRVPVLCWLVIKMDERWSYASLSKKWMSTGIMLAWHRKMDEYWSYAGLSLKMNAVLSHTILSKSGCSPVSCHFVIKMDAALSHTGVCYHICIVLPLKLM